MADSAAEGTMRVRLVDASFSKVGGEREVSTDRVTSNGLRGPDYPPQAVTMQGEGTVMLLVKVGRDGRVADVIAEQTNLTVIGTARAMNQLRDILAKASVNSAKRWTFTPPTTGEDKNRDFWTVRVPVRYAFQDSRERYGRWTAYIHSRPAPAGAVEDRRGNPGRRNRPAARRRCVHGGSCAGRPAPAHPAGLMRGCGMHRACRAHPA